MIMSFSEGHTVLALGASAASDGVNDRHSTALAPVASVHRTACPKGVV